MKSVFTIFLLVGFVGVTVFGVFAMNHEMKTAHAGCITATVQGIDCPKEADTLSFLAFHVSTFRDFSTAVFQENLGSAVAFFLLLGMLAISFFKGFHFFAFVFKSFAFSPRLVSVFSFEQERLRWIALHETSPTLF